MINNFQGIEKISVGTITIFLEVMQFRVIFPLQNIVLVNQFSYITYSNSKYSGFNNDGYVGNRSFTINISRFTKLITK